MTFTSTLPTQPGFYAWKRADLPKHQVYVSEVFATSTGALIERNSDLQPKDVGGLWCRLVPAEELSIAWGECLLWHAKVDAAVDNGTACPDGWNSSRARKVAEGSEHQ